MESLENSNNLAIIVNNGKVTFYNLEDLMVTVGGLSHLLFTILSPLPNLQRAEKQIRLEFNEFQMGTPEMINELFELLNSSKIMHVLVEIRDDNIVSEYSFYDCVLVEIESDANPMLTSYTQTIYFNVTGDVVMEDNEHGRQDITCGEVR